MIHSYRGGKMFQSDQRARINLVLWYFYILLLIRKYYLDVLCNKLKKEFENKIIKKFQEVIKPFN